jgi:signal transduction histidine kinase/DNA-binding response OmpR family regulator
MVQFLAQREAHTYLSLFQLSRTVPLLRALFVPARLSPSEISTPSEATAVPTPPETKIHPLVRLNFLVRMFGLPLPAVALFLVFQSTDRTSPWLILLIVLWALVWPHVGFAHARFADDGKAAEIRNLLIDSLIIGAWIAATYFTFALSVALGLGLYASLMSVGGPRLALKGLSVALIGGLAMGAYTGFAVHLEAPGPVITLSMIALFAYVSVFGYSTHYQAKRAVWRRKQVQAQNLQIQEHSRALERARADAESSRVEAEAAAEAAERANQAKSQFLANMSHELRTPLNAIIGYSEMLMEDGEDMELAEIVADLRKIRGAGKHLLGLINNVLDLSKVEAGKMEVYLEQIDVEALVGDVAATLEPLVTQGEDQLEVQLERPLGSMSTDVTKVKQILLNLLSNALKFTERGNVTLTVLREARQEGEWIVFRVHDDGIGMTPQQMARLFQPFVQADASTTRKFGGTGLGLTISRRFAQLLGGDIAVDSTPGEGSTFELRLAVDAAAVPKPEAELEPRPDVVAATGTVRDGAGTAPIDTDVGSGPRVLIIEDDPHSRDILAQTLRKSGFRTIEAADGDTGLAHAREMLPDLVTLDVLMPGLDGWSVLRQLKADPLTASIPVVLATITDDRALGYSLGAAGYVTKPFDREHLVRTLRGHLRTRAPGTVLVVEDDAPTREMLRRGLEREGWTVYETATVAESLALLRQRRPDLVLLDLLLPDGTGFDVLDVLRASPATADLPVVVLTAKDVTGEERETLNHHVKRVFEKGRAAQTDVLAEVRRLLPLAGAAPEPEAR